MKHFISCFLLMLLLLSCSGQVDNEKVNLQSCNELNDIMLAFEQNGDSTLLDSAERLCNSLEMGELTKEGKMILNLRKPEVLMARSRVRDALAWKCQYLSTENMDV
ncbi:MAG: hypothetical protein J6S96_06805 [Muribaculaceae bacterium]|nr:hypothetical protein [Muribaculaceae bacterium]